MKYTSTRDKSVSVSASEAIVTGLSPDGGLFVPTEIPKLSEGQLGDLLKMDYPERAAYIMKLYLDEFTEEELLGFTRDAYSKERFPGGAAQMKFVEDHWFLELWHGPTGAFKDIALQMLPKLLCASLEKTGQKEKVLILTATSGDTGKAALEGFADVENTKIMVFYPANGVSDIQRLQMTTQRGNNVCVKAVRGDFDDTQTGVKKIISNARMRRLVGQYGYKFSSANSINWGRLLPQIAYYVSAWCDMVTSGCLDTEDEIYLSVPTGNFGNILAAYYAREMGIPIAKLICASNENNILTRFFETGVYMRKGQKLHKTISPSMDILISSNLERLLYLLAGSPVKVKDFMTSLSKDGYYYISREMQKKVQEVFEADFCGDDRTRMLIDYSWKTKLYLIDPHTAVAESAMENFLLPKRFDGHNAVVVSTANPYKFGATVLESIEAGYLPWGDPIARLERATGVPAPRSLTELKDLPERFTDRIRVNQMSDAVLKFAAEEIASDD